MLSFVGSGWLPRLLEAARFTGDREKGLTRHVHERWRAAICTAAVGAALMGTPCQSLADAQLSISPSTVAAVSSVSPASTMESLKEYDRRLNRAVFEDAWGAVYTMFYDHTAGSRFTNDDWREERDRIISNGTFVFSTRERTYDAIRDAVAAIGDPYTRFLTPDEWQAELASRTASVLNSAGVGLQLTDPFDGVEDLKVTAPLPESPAEEAGIAPGDYLVAIDGIDVAHARMTPDEAIAILRGTEGSPVYLDVLSGTDDELRKVTVNRRRLSMKPIKSEILENENGRLGYVRVHFFISSAREALIEEVTKMVGSGVDGIVLDVRNCLGGIFQEALGMGALFFDRPDCILAKTVDGNGIEREHIVEKQDCILPQMRVTQVPLAVLVNGGSASASEVLAAALQDNHRAILVGEQTFGKGLIQHTFPLRDGSAVVMTVAEYITPKRHRHVQDTGIRPDYLCRETPVRKAMDDPCVEQAQKQLQRLHAQPLTAVPT